MTIVACFGHDSSDISRKGAKAQRNKEKIARE